MQIVKTVKIAISAQELRQAIVEFVQKDHADLGNPANWVILLPEEGIGEETAQQESEQEDTSQIHECPLVNPFVGTTEPVKEAVPNIFLPLDLD